MSDFRKLFVALAAMFLFVFWAMPCVAQTADIQALSEADREFINFGGAAEIMKLDSAVATKDSLRDATIRPPFGFGGYVRVGRMTQQAQAEVRGVLVPLQAQGVLLVGAMIISRWSGQAFPNPTGWMNMYNNMPPGTAWSGMLGWGEYTLEIRVYNFNMSTRQTVQVYFVVGAPVKLSWNDVVITSVSASGMSAQVTGSFSGGALAAFVQADDAAYAPAGSTLAYGGWNHFPYVTIPWVSGGNLIGVELPAPVLQTIGMFGRPHTVGVCAGNIILVKCFGVPDAVIIQKQ